MKAFLLAAGAMFALAAPAAAQVSPTIPPSAPSGATASNAPPAGDTDAGLIAGPDDARVNQLIIYGDDSCPPSTNEQINVCAKLPEGDRYRIPENLRTSDDPQSNSWYNRAIELSYVGRTGTDSCSPVGPGGQTGCFNQLVAQARAERRGGDAVNWNALIEQARQERLGRIDADAEAVEAVEAEANEPR